jgi:hypothetical protein
MQQSSANTMPAKGRSASRKRPTWLLIALIVVLIATLVVGVAALAGYFFLRNENNGAWSWQDPLTAVDTSRIRPDIAVIALLDQPAGVVAQQAFEAHEDDTAYAALAHSSTMSDIERSGALLLLGGEYEATGAFDLASLAYQQMADLAALSPVMPDTMRAQSSLDAAEGFIRLDRADSAGPLLRQAEALARYSPLLAPIQRQETARRLRDIYRSLGDEDQAQALDQLVREPRGLPTDRYLRGPFISGFQGTFVFPLQLQQAVDERRLQAIAFINSWDSADPATIEQARSRLAGALLVEDDLRSDSLRASFEAAQTLPDEAAVAQEYVNWLALKQLIADDALGYALVPEWQQEQISIREELKGAYDTLLGLYREQAAELADPNDMAAARVEILKLHNLWGRLGLYPGYDEQGLAEALRQAQEQAMQVLPLLVLDEPWGDGIVFRLSEALE